MFIEYKRVEHLDFTKPDLDIDDHFASNVVLDGEIRDDVRHSWIFVVSFNYSV